MLVTSGHEAVGSVSGGCVEGTLFDVGLEILDNGVPQYHKYGISDDEAFGVGLTCGGIIEVFAERCRRWFRAGVRRFAAPATKI